jgi:hypothetical protein
VCKWPYVQATEMVVQWAPSVLNSAIFCKVGTGGERKRNFTLIFEGVYIDGIWRSGRGYVFGMDLCSLVMNRQRLTLFH